jgi:hypothetical protein
MELTPPIFLFDDQDGKAVDVTVLPSVDDAERFLEPPDIRLGPVFDSMGRRLIPRLERVGALSQTRLDLATTSEEPAELASRIRSILTRMGDPLADANLPTDEFVAAAAQKLLSRQAHLGVFGVLRRWFGRHQ